MGEVLYAPRAGEGRQVLQINSFKSVWTISGHSTTAATVHEAQCTAPIQQALVQKDLAPAEHLVRGMVGTRRADEQPAYLRRVCARRPSGVSHAGGLHAGAVAETARGTPTASAVRCGAGGAGVGRE
jgi:hypothetical protein